MHLLQLRNNSLQRQLRISDQSNLGAQVLVQIHRIKCGVDDFLVLRHARTKRCRCKTAANAKDQIAVVNEFVNHFCRRMSA